MTSVLKNCKLIALLSTYASKKDIIMLYAIAEYQKSPIEKGLPLIIDLSIRL